MANEQEYYYVNIRDILAEGYVNEEELQRQLSQFSCVLNHDVEHF